MAMHNRKRNLLVILCLFFILFFLLLPFEVKVQLEDNIRLFEGQDHCFKLQFPLDLYVRADREGIISLNGTPLTWEKYSILKFRNDIFLTGLSRGSANLELSLFRGLIPLRQLTVNVLPEIELMAGGHSIGIKLHKQGVIAVGFYYLERGDGFFSPAEESGIIIGDVLLAVNGLSLMDMDRAVEIIKRQAAKGDLNFTVKRGREELEITVTPYLCPQSGEYKLGLYIRDTAAGVGTLTFYNPLDNYYGALGHMITDLDTGLAVEINDGLIVRADVINIKMAQKGKPGEKAGIFREGKDILGTIEKNTFYGIYGRLKHIDASVTPYPEPIPLGLSFQVEPGPAELLTVIEGNKIQSFKIDIEKIINQSQPADKGMVLRIVDENLLEVTGGIVQGMSGSPIVQNGKLVGAVTHVFVNDPSRGYGIFAEWMVKEAGILPLS